MAACTWSVANIQIKLLGEINGLSLNAWIGILATPQLLLGSWLLEDGQLEALAAADWRAYASIAYQAIVVVILGYGLWYHLLRRYDVNQVMPCMLLVPVFGVFSGIAVLGETISPVFVVGGCLTILGVGIIILKRPKLVAPAAKRV